MQVHTHRNLRFADAAQGSGNAEIKGLKEIADADDAEIDPPDFNRILLCAHESHDLIGIDKGSQG
ncbi:hypothetical protein SDC9_79802 [bioreactor metagenome]|uniref:Uncharacterized protein n=1 Tax=bioreactor metagenome TaxID=1076179 RepID=A0A644Z3B0_9ZZZZ